MTRLDVPINARMLERESSVETRYALTVPAQIAIHATLDPDQLAVIEGSLRLTYGQLESRSNQLAAYLRAAGANSETCVGLLFERSHEFVVAALAVLKSGAAYLPLDSSTPTDRAAFILENAGALMLLSHCQKATRLDARAWRVIALDGRDAEGIAKHRATPISDTSAPSDLAYVVYTSGSTGRPKGVEITHANLGNLVAWHRESFHVTDADRASQIAGLGFDAAAWEIWPHLTAGASLHIADESIRRSPQALRDWLVSEKITISFVPTILAEQLLNMSWPKGTALRTLLTGADTLHRRPDARLPFAFVNNYGPTECTVVTTSGTVAPDGAFVGPPSIGRPITNTKVLILDDAMRPVPEGEPGELCIAGAGVGRGYRNAPELTSSRFVMYSPDSGPSVRIYRTGDRARRLEGGEIAFLGRSDDQVKIRGYRIELGEIIACLDRYPGVDASALLVRDSVPVQTPAAEASERNPALVAYVVAAHGARLNAFDLRAFLKARLPDYMIPEWYVAIDTLPITANGKLDKSAFPTPCEANLLPTGTQDCEAISRPEDSDAALAPSAAFTQKIAAAVASLLDLPSIENDDNFFMSGGHSMFGVQLVSRLRDMFGIKLTLRQLFNAPTVTSLSAEVSRLVESAEAKAV